MNNSSSTESLSFPQAIAATQSLMARIQADKLSETEIEQEVLSILSNKNGGRGFFVSYLTSDISLADRPSEGIINGLKSSIKISGELLVKNLAMSSAMIITHSRDRDIENIKGSQRVYQRTNNLIRSIDSSSVYEELQKLLATIDNKNGEYQKFLQCWSYDTEQKQAIANAITTALK